MGRFARYPAFLAIVMVWSAGLAAERQTPTVEIVDWGLTRAKEVGTEVSPDTPTGLNRLVEGPVDVTRSTTIRACIGTSFGVLYRVPNSEDIVLPIVVVVLHPMIRTPDGRSMGKSSWQDNATSLRRYAGWVFERDFELVSGSWTILLRDPSGRELASKQFDVTAGSCPIS
ncbi:DUF3859 domain-containing protein [Phyllobacterium endophyticum]|uniref:DUF3859 domain-containing protein n=1 Tax=Phyllobacterium endophyticum TaxID=1149773 RepID=A0A2P7B0I7_9HYPH|nr:DUF3859 domain-containing protein [Phyllobacterium endophyticum]MBB3235429.1 hypothetical protein [Phyllobacterium endophyticum]PSH59914.1 hypothetical protein CU100_03975 [Phyllobacterium endophyticum]TXR50043.1 DUF3859 domain-containing protein [Phyllobacterium endophyticum]TYR42072.1 DUF3859 domain-containing protein [Phyllobacterium endophyticum]